MCGIAAVITAQGTVRPLDLCLLAHRGPDAHGEWTSPDDRIWFGHTRLAIVDLTPTGAQPMHDPVTGNVIIFNGEIYNHLELREEMQGAAIEWAGTSDTETLLVAYRLWGEHLLPRLKGMFAFAIFDADRKSVFVARGPAGIKPLYFTAAPGLVRLSSEVRPLLADMKLRTSRAAVSSYLQWGTFPEKDFLFPEVKMLPAGCWMAIDPEGAVTTKQYWPGRGFARRAPQPAPAQVRQLMEKVVHEHLMADVPVASFLSGGIDSSIITALASQGMGARRLQTFSVGFPHGEFDETDIAAIVAKRYGTEHHRIEVGDEEAIALVQEAVRQMDVPSVDAVNTFIVSKKVAEAGIKVSLSGLGGDELFGGYPSFADAPILHRLARIPQVARGLFGRAGKLGRRLADLPEGGDLETIAIWRRRLWSDAMLARAGLPVTPLRPDPPPDLTDDFARISWAEMTVYMRQMLLRDSDQMSMAVSLELRVPFLDRELIEYVLGLPAKEKMRYGMPKGLLVEACRDLLPTEVYNRPKAGFSLPMDIWMRGPLLAFTNQGLDEIDRLELLAPGSVGWIRGQFERRKIHWTRIWSLVVLGHYLEKLGMGAGSGQKGLAGPTPFPKA